MLSRHILATCLIAVMGGAASGQVDESPLDVLKRLRAEEQAEQQNPLDQFDILDLPEHLFERRTPTQPRRKLPPLELDRDWDYRFDVQYQSTINPYRRWYMRQNPATPRKRYLSKEYRAGRHGFHASADGYSAYGLPVDQFGYPINPDYQGQYGSVRYWDHLNWLYQQYSQTSIDRSYRTRGRPSLGVPRPLDLLEQLEQLDQKDEVVPPLPDLFTKTKPTTMRSLRRQQIWVSRHNESGRMSVLYVKPSAAAASKFHEAQAAMTGASSILALKWVTKPAWASHVELQAGRLQSVKQKNTERLASAK